MTQLQYLKRNLKEVKSYMKYHKPLIGYLGNQYHYWINEKTRIENEIHFIKNVNEYIKLNKKSSKS